MPDPYTVAGLATYSLGPRDRSIASLSGASQLLMPANPNRRDFVVQNCGANAIYFTFTKATVVADAVGIIEIAVGAAVTASMLGELVPKGAMYVLGTAAQPCYAHETSGFPERTP